ncbi:hypothetical protein DXG01_001616 [Tephrocybe rancida]|nr:hypothetical protein DXG01_001616 [Tephrocybe rancida]
MRLATGLGHSHPPMDLESGFVIAFLVSTSIVAGAIFTLCGPRHDTLSRSVQTINPLVRPAASPKGPHQASKKFSKLVPLILNLEVFFAMTTIFLDGDFEISSLLAIFERDFWICAEAIDELQNSSTVLAIAVLSIALAYLYRYRRRNRIGNQNIEKRPMMKTHLPRDSIDTVSRWIKGTSTAMFLYSTVSALLDYLEEASLFGYYFPILTTCVRINEGALQLVAVHLVISVVTRSIPSQHVLPPLKWLPLSKPPISKPPISNADTQKPPVQAPPAPQTWQHLNTLLGQWRSAPTDPEERARRLSVSRAFVEPWNEVNKITLRVYEDRLLKSSITQLGDLTTENNLENFLLSATCILKGILQRSALLATHPKIAILGGTQRTLDVIGQWLSACCTLEARRRRLVLSQALTVWHDVLGHGVYTLTQTAIIEVLRDAFSGPTSTHATFETLLSKSVETMKEIQAQQRRIRDARQRAHALELRQRRAEQRQAQRPKPRLLFPRAILSTFFALLRPVTHYDSDGRSSRFRRT